ncbi:MAG: type IV secretory system conjugative DNA transfer family protein, partial [Cyclobacteriaceae bacterium]|nr:type IV secretory system conjugative DNA transfer family protein [Cyclobacteriaceae bacterium]
IENESFDQERRKINSPFSINVPMKFYYRHKMQKGWLNIINPFRGTLLIGTPGSGKTYSIIVPTIKQHLAKRFSMVVYDFKYPELAKVAYYHYRKQLKKGKLANFNFHVVNLNQLEKSRRVNPLKGEYITTMASAIETAEALIEALRKTDKSHGADQFFSQSAINFLSAIIYYFSRYEKGKYSTLAHVMAFTNHSYEEIFDTLHKAPELESLLAPFQSAYEKRAFDQLEGQIGTLRINLSRLATKETYWIFSGDDVPLKISDPKNPAVLVIANDPETQSINSACYSVVLNRLIRQLNQKGNLPCSMVIDEVPTVYIHKIENLLATARSNKVSILLGLQELPQFRQQYGREVAETICSVAANVLSGAVRHKDTLMWLEKLFGKVRQVRNGISVDRHRTSINMNEYMDFLIPASKIANLKTGELVGHIAGESEQVSGKYNSNIYHCKIKLNQSAIRKEEKRYTDTPDYYDFGEEKEKVLTENMQKIIGEVKEVVGSGC